MLMELLSKAATVAMLSFVVSSMLAMGAGLTVSQISEPLRNVRLVVLALLANFLLMPLGALALAKVLWLDEPFGVGLLVLGCAAGAPFLPKLAELAKGNLAFAVGVMVLLMVVTVGYLPIVLPLLLPGITVDPWEIARSLLLLMLLPLVIGLALKRALRELGRTGETRARLDFQHQPHSARVLNHRSEHRQGFTSVRHPRNFRGASVYRIRPWDGLVARRA
jgi:BASS family bile acid:Na+ symporter